MRKTKSAKTKMTGTSISSYIQIVDTTLSHVSLIYGVQTSLDILKAFTKSYRAALKNEKQAQRKFYQKNPL
jgi:hypothetical protein